MTSASKVKKAKPSVEEGLKECPSTSAGYRPGRGGESCGAVVGKLSLQTLKVLPERRFRDW